MAVNAADAFEHFFDESEPFVRRALVSRFGAELGRDATAEGFAAAWRSWDRVSTMENRSGYVYRVGERWAVRQEKKSRPPAVEAAVEVKVMVDRYGDPELAAALDALSPKQRQAVVLVWSFGYSHREAAELLGCARSSLQNHVERGLKNLRQNLEVNDSA